jgi:hypothetical protein
VKYLPPMTRNTQTAELRKGESVKSPKVECEYLTSDKPYVVKKVFIDGRFLIKDDSGKNIFCQVLKCGHLDGLDWILNN